MRRPRRGGGARRSACLKTASLTCCRQRDAGPVRDSFAFCFPLRETGIQNYGIHRCAHRFMKPPQAASDMIRVPYGQKDKPHGCGACLFGDPYGTRTHVTAVKGRCLNHLTNGPYEKGAGDGSAPFFGSGTWIRTGDTSGMNRMLWPTELCRHMLPKQHLGF